MRKRYDFILSVTCFNSHLHFLQKLPLLIFCFNILRNICEILQMYLYGIYYGWYSFSYDRNVSTFVKLDPPSDHRLGETHFRIRAGLHEVCLRYPFIRNSIVNDCFVTAVLYYVFSLVSNLPFLFGNWFYRDQL